MPPARLVWLVALAGALTVAACGPGATPSDDAADTTVAASTTAVEAAAGLPVLRPASGDLGARAITAGVVSVPGGFLAIGERLADDVGGGDVQSVTTFWRSADGRSWTMADADPAIWGDWTADRVAQGPAGIVVLAGGDRGRALLTSADGETWTATEVTAGALGLPADTYPGAFPVNDVAAIDGGFLALGQLVGGGGGVDVDVEPLLLFSSDGVTWRRATGPALAPTSVPPEYIAGRAALDGTTYLFVTADQGAAVSVWSSTDAVTWAPVGGPELFGGVDQPVLAAATSFNGRLVAAGHDDASGAAAVWTSDDGRRWTLASGDGLEGPGRSSPELFAPVEGALLMIGTSEPGSDGVVTGVVWTSPDGEAWRRARPDEAPITGRVDVVGAASAGVDVAVVGSQYPGAVDLATVQMSAWWVEEIEG
ncbi:MAG: hypothetical protein ACRD0A_13145 [Acidimicrobiales bacterium]